MCLSFKLLLFLFYFLFVVNYLKIFHDETTERKFSMIFFCIDYTYYILL